MQRKRVRLSLASSFLLTLCLCAGVSAQQAGRIESMKLLAPDTGWAATKSHLFWTTNGGAQWKDVTPHTPGTEEIASVFFLNRSVGWILVTRRSQTSNDVSGFDLISTANAGKDWTIKPVSIPEMSAEVLLPGDARMNFVDPLHGWINVGGAGNSAFNAGFLIATTDGGNTWSATHGGKDLEQGGRGPILFTSVKDGWFTNGLELYVTHDSASHWRKVSLTAPSQVKAATGAAYDLPFIQNGHTFLAVTYSSPYFPVADAQSTVVLFCSNDAGESWKVDRILPNLAEISTGEIAPSTMASSTWIVIAKSRAGNQMIAAVTPGGKSRPLTEIASGISVFSFVDGIRGWAIGGLGELFSTTDSGSSWGKITPGPRTPSHSPENDVPTNKQHSENISTPGTATISTHIGFDQSLVASPSSMLTWWRSSPYFDAAFYLNGGHNRTSDPNLTASWITNVSNQGWGFMPIWVDYQAPCACNTARAYIQTAQVGRTRV